MCKQHQHPSGPRHPALSVGSQAKGATGRLIFNQNASNQRKGLFSWPDGKLASEGIKLTQRAARPLHGSEPFSKAFIRGSRSVPALGGGRLFWEPFVLEALCKAEGMPGQGCAPRGQQEGRGTLSIARPFPPRAHEDPQHLPALLPAHLQLCHEAEPRWHQLQVSPLPWDSAPQGWEHPIPSLAFLPCFSASPPALQGTARLLLSPRASRKQENNFKQRLT